MVRETTFRPHSHVSRSTLTTQPSPSPPLTPHPSPLTPHPSHPTLAKVVSFIDLAGHEKYLRTTVYGLTAHEPDYVMVVVGANHGVTRMTKEHVGMAIALNVPLFVVITKVDLCPEPVMKETIKQLLKLLKLPGARKQPYAVRSLDDLVVACAGFGKSAITPIFTISCVSGVGVPLLRQFFNLMPTRRKWAELDSLPPEFLIDQYFNVPGVGLVVAGTLIRGVVGDQQLLLMGPNNQGKFNPVPIKSIHHMRSPVAALLPGQTGAFVVKSKTKEHVRNLGIRKGMVLLDSAPPPAATRRFCCDVLVLHSQTTMRVNYQPILYARNVRQCVRIAKMDKEVLRTGVRAQVTFEFMYRPEYLRTGTKVCPSPRPRPRPRPRLALSPTSSAALTPTRTLALSPHPSPSSTTYTRYCSPRGRLRPLAPSASY